MNLGKKKGILTANGGSDNPKNGDIVNGEEDIDMPDILPELESESPVAATVDMSIDNPVQRHSDISMLYLTRLILQHKNADGGIDTGKQENSTAEVERNTEIDSVGSSGKSAPGMPSSLF